MGKNGSHTSVPCRKRKLNRAIHRIWTLKEIKIPLCSKDVSIGINYTTLYRHFSGLNINENGVTNSNTKLLVQMYMYIALHLYSSEESSVLYSRILQVQVYTPYFLHINSQPLHPNFLTTDLAVPRYRASYTQSTLAFMFFVSFQL
jgi:hypothetical protein